MATPEDAGYTISAKPIYEDGQITRYATQDPTVFIEFFTPPQQLIGDPPPDFQKYLDLYDGMRTELLEQGLEAYVPEVLDSDIEDLWIAFGVSEGLYSIDEVAKNFPDGLNGRDWAWMLRRVFIVLDVAGRRPNLDRRNFLVHPENHDIVLLGWDPIEDPDVYPLAQLAELMEDLLMDSVDSASQIELIRKMEQAYRRNRRGQHQIKLDPEQNLFGYEDALSEYELKLQHLYGPPKFRPLILDEGSKPFLSEESELV